MEWVLIVGWLLGLAVAGGFLFIVWNILMYPFAIIGVWLTPKLVYKTCPSCGKKIKGVGRRESYHWFFEAHTEYPDFCPSCMEGGIRDVEEKAEGFLDVFGSTKNVAMPKTQKGLEIRPKNFCPSCGQKVTDPNANFCSGCGEDLS